MTVTRLLGDAMATADAERIRQELDRAKKHGRLVKERRLDLGLKRPAFVAEVSRHGEEMTPDYLNKIEAGTRPLANAAPQLREAIRAVLGYSPEQWQELTGLYTPSAEAPRTAAPFDPRTLFHPPAQRRREKRDLSPNLAQMIEEKQEKHEALRETRWQQYLNNTRFATGHEPDAEGWFEMYQALRRNKVEPEPWLESD